jgi:hypothetical protein
MAKKLYGTDPDQVPTNADLGTVAYQDKDNVVIDGGSARINAARPGSDNTARAELELYASGDAPTYIVNNSDRSGAGQHIAEFRGQWDGTAVARMVFAAGTDTTNKDDGVLSFWTASAGTMAKAAEFTSGGNLAFPNGQGIDFSASEGSNAIASVLDDYEEGTWTPTFGADGSNPTMTYSAQVGRYTKIGNLVTAYCQMITASRSGGSGALTVDGLPYTVAPAVTFASATIGFNYNWNTPPLNAGAQGGQTHVILYQDGTTNTGATPVDIVASGSSYFYFMVSYETTL